MKPPISYYGGKQTLAGKIVSMIPDHNLYCEPFIGGAAVFFAKPASNVEVINDTNKELINFYRVVQNDFVSLEKEIRITLHSRDLHRKAKVIYDNPDMFSEIKRAWAVWTLANQSFSSMLDGTWGYDIKKATMPKKLQNRKEGFTEEFAIRLQNVSIECTDALRIIRSRDTADAFFYCDPPYYNSDCGHYDGYTLADFKELLDTLAGIKGKFMLSSYPSPILKEYTQSNSWNTTSLELKVSVANTAKSAKPQKKKTEVITYNYTI